MTGRYTEGIGGVPLPDGKWLQVIGPVPAAAVARARDLRRTRAMPAHMLLDGEIGNEVAAESTTEERRAELRAEAGERRLVRAAIAPDPKALDLLITARVLTGEAPS